MNAPNSATKYTSYAEDVKAEVSDTKVMSREEKIAELKARQGVK